VVNKRARPGRGPRGGVAAVQQRREHGCVRDETVITLSGTAANLVLAAGDTVIWNSTHVGTGITDPGGLVSVTLT
jgi:hypothetical protein